MNQLLCEKHLPMQLPSTGKWQWRKTSCFKTGTIDSRVRWMSLYSPLRDVVNKHTIIESLAWCFIAIVVLELLNMCLVFFLEVMSAVTQLFWEINACNASRYEFLKNTQEKALNNLSFFVYIPGICNLRCKFVQWDFFLIRW